MSAQGSPKNRSLVQSLFLVEFPVDESWTCVTHPIRGVRRFLDTWALTALRQLSEPSTVIGLASRLRCPQTEVARLLRDLEADGFVVAADTDERADLLRACRTRVQSLELQPRAATALHLGGAELRRRVPVRQGTSSMSFLVLGNCGASRLAEALIHAGEEEGVRVTVAVGWTDDVGAIERSTADVILYQPFNVWLLSGLLDTWSHLRPEERIAALERVRSHIRERVNLVAGLAGGRLLLVQGIPVPSVAPGGRASRQEFVAVAEELNAEVRTVLEPSPRTTLLDVQHLFARFGGQGYPSICAMPERT